MAVAEAHEAAGAAAAAGRLALAAEQRRRQHVREHLLAHALGPAEEQCMRQALLAQHRPQLRLLLSVAEYLIPVRLHRDHI